jgi:hypothetical protein
LSETKINKFTKTNWIEKIYYCTGYTVYNLEIL